MGFHNNPKRYGQGRFSYAYFTDEEPGSERLKKLFTFMQLYAEMGLEPTEE